VAGIINVPVITGYMLTVTSTMVMQVLR